MMDQQLIATLHQKGCKVTPQRIAICRFLLSSKDHPTADQVYQVVKKTYPTISLATVYQTLRLLIQIGLLQELESTDRTSRYDSNTSPHINIICKKCGKVQDYETENIRKLWFQIIKDLGFQPIGQRLDIYRYCEQCQAEKSSNHAQ